MVVTTDVAFRHATAPGIAVSVSDLRKLYGKGDHTTVALDGISLEIREGERLGLLGPNGAGKTTFVSILATQLTPTAGTASIFGHDVAGDPDAVRRSIGYVP